MTNDEQGVLNIEVKHSPTLDIRYLKPIFRFFTRGRNKYDEEEKDQGLDVEGGA